MKRVESFDGQKSDEDRSFTADFRRRRRRTQIWREWGLEFEGKWKQIPANCGIEGQAEE